MDEILYPRTIPPRKEQEMKFIIKGMKYDTEKMKLIANVEKWYKVDNIFSRALYGERSRKVL